MNPPKGLEDLQSVDKVRVVQDSYADYVAILNEPHKQEVRVHYLKHLREQWAWRADFISEKHGNGYVQFKRKGEL